MNDEEVERLFRIASIPLRTKWEEQQNKGRSLTDVRRARETALVESEAYLKVSKFSYIFGCIFTPIFLFCIFLLYYYFQAIKSGSIGDIIAAILVVSIIVILIVVPAYYQGKSLKKSHEARDCDDILERFGKSLAALNPLGTGNSHHDLINEGYINDNAVALAVRIVDTQESFDNICNTKNRNRYHTNRCGQWLEKCENEMERFEATLMNNFGLTLDKRSIFDQAKAHLAKSKPKPSGAIVAN